VEGLEQQGEDAVANTVVISARSMGCTARRKGTLPAPSMAPVVIAAATRTAASSQGTPPARAMATVTTPLAP
jgi:hypothetical protein